jgi:uncharacterized membrane protein
VRLHFQATPADLYLVLGYTVAVSGAILATNAANLLGLALVILVPGYLGMACALPRADDADWTLRIALSLGLSLAFVAFLGIALNLLPWGITLPSVTVADLFLSLALGALAYRRRMTVPAQERLEATLDFQAARWQEYSLPEKGLAVLLVAVLVVATPLLALSLTHPRPTPGYSELYLLGPTGNFSGIPSVLNVSQSATVLVVVTDHEGVAVNYTLRVDLVGVGSVYNATSGTNQTVELNRTTWSTFPVDLASGAAWNQSYTFSIATAGTWQVQFLLFRGTDLSTPYRFVRLDVAVRA